MRLKLAFSVLLLSSFAFAQQTQQQRRIVRPVNNASSVRLQGTLAPRARADLDRGPVVSSMRLDRMTMVFSRTAAQQAELDRLLAAQHDPILRITITGSRPRNSATALEWPRPM